MTLSQKYLNRLTHFQNYAIIELLTLQIFGVLAEIILCPDLGRFN
jgi:hypothetical protein